MVITFATQKGGAGKTTMAIAFANYISTTTQKKINVYDFDFQKSFYNKWKDDEEFSEFPKIYDVEIIGEDGENPFTDFEKLEEIKESDEINIFDLAGTLDEKYTDLLIYSDVIVTPFEYADVSIQSTMVFINILKDLDSEAERVFIRSKYDKGYKYLNQTEMDEQISKHGILINNPVFKRNCLQTIDTRRLTYEQKYAVKKPFTELIEYLNETFQITI